MRYMIMCLVCLLALAGCGGGGGSADNSIKLKGYVESTAHVTAVNVYQQGHVGEAGYLIASTLGPNTFVVKIPQSGVYDVQILYDYYLGWDGLLVHDTRVITNVQVDAPLTDLGTIVISIPPSQYVHIIHYQNKESSKTC